MKSSALLGRTWLVVIACWLGCPAGAEAGFGRFLPNAPFVIGPKKVDSYQQMAPIAFDQDILINGMRVGSIKFDYATFMGRFGNNNIPSGG